MFRVLLEIEARSFGIFIFRRYLDVVVVVIFSDLSRFGVVGFWVFFVYGRFSGWYSGSLFCVGVICFVFEGEGVRGD